MIKNNLSKILDAKQLKMSELERMTGLSESTIRRVYYNLTSTISFNTLNKLCWALECNVTDILEYVEE